MLRLRFRCPNPILRSGNRGAKIVGSCRIGLNCGLTHYALTSKRGDNIDNALRFTALLVSTLLAPCAAAVILELSPSVQEAAVGSRVTYDIVYDPNGRLPFFGVLNIAYDADVIELVGYRYGQVGDADLQFAPRKSDGVLERLTAGSLIGLESSGVLASLTFRVVREGLAYIRLVPVVGSWYDQNGDTVGLETRNALAASDGFPYPLLRTSADVTLDGIAVNETRSVTVSAHNDGTGPLRIWSAESVPEFFFGVGFIVTADACSGQTVAAGHSCLLDLDFVTDKFLPTRSHRATVSFSASDARRLDTQIELEAVIDSPLIALPDIELLAASMAAPYRQRSIKLTNSGEIPAWIREFRITPLVGTGEFDIVKDHCTERFVAARQHCIIVVEFRPVEQGRSLARFEIFYGDQPGATGFSVFANNAELVGVTPTGLPFVDYGGPQEIRVGVGEPIERRITLTNKGPVALNVLSNTMGGSSVFAPPLSDCFGASLGTGEHCAITLTGVSATRGRFDWQSFLTTDSDYQRQPVFELRVIVD